MLPSNLYRAADVRELDRTAIEVAGIPGIELMERAGREAFGVLRIGGRLRGTWQSSQVRAITEAMATWSPGWRPSVVSTFLLS